MGDYFNTQDGVTEIDLRKEFAGFIDGDPWDLPKGKVFIFRRMRRKTDRYPLKESDLISTPAIHGKSNTTDKIYPNIYSESERFLFDDAFVKAYRRGLLGYKEKVDIQAFTELETSIFFFYFHHTIMPCRFDKIIEPECDYDGEIVSPVKAVNFYRIQQAIAFSSDGTETSPTTGRVEYWRCLTNLEHTPELLKEHVNLDAI